MTNDAGTDGSKPPAEGRIVVCTYRVRAGSEAAFEALLERHVPTLRRLGLIAEFPTQALRRIDGGQTLYVEVIEWISPDAATRADEVPEVIVMWEAMAALCESRDGLPGLEFPIFERVGRGK